MRRAPIRLHAIALISLFAAGEARAQVPCETNKVTATEPDNDDRFGWSVSTSAGWTLVGAYKRDDNGLNSGAAYAYRTVAGAVEERQLLAIDGTSFDKFGWSVALDSNVAVVGAPEEDDLGQDSGAVYVFRFDGNNWLHEQKLVAQDGEADDGFGFSVAISADRIVVGANGEDDGGADAGAAYVFRGTHGAWFQEAKLMASDAAAGDDFGVSVSVSGGRALVGAEAENSGGTLSGAAYVFRDDGGTWAEEQKLLRSDPGVNDRFGYSVSLSGDAALVGAFADDAGADTSGSAYVFRRAGTVWTQEDKLVAPDLAVADVFGWSVALDGDVALVGARLEDASGTDSGSAYVYRNKGGDWGPGVKLAASDGSADDQFGWAVAVQDGMGVVGAWHTEEAGENEAGAAYLFSGLNALDCNGNGLSDACDITSGTSQDADVDGIPDECQLGTTYCSPAVANSTGGPGVMRVLGSTTVADDDLTLRATQLPPQPNIGYFIMGTGMNTFTPPGSAGPICVAPGIRRFLPPVNNTTEQNGGFARTVGTSGPVSGNITPGSTWNFQAWHRDSLAGTSNLTDAVTVDFQ